MVLGSSKGWFESGVLLWSSAHPLQEGAERRFNPCRVDSRSQTRFWHATETLPPQAPFLVLGGPAVSEMFFLDDTVDYRIAVELDLCPNAHLGQSRPAHTRTSFSGAREKDMEGYSWISVCGSGWNLGISTDQPKIRFHDLFSTCVTPASLE